MQREWTASLWSSRQRQGERWGGSGWEVWLQSVATAPAGRGAPVGGGEGKHDLRGGGRGGTDEDRTVGSLC